MATYAKIKVGGVVAGTLTLLGSEMNEEATYCFILVSNRKIAPLIAICQGAFDSSERLIGVDKESVLLARKRVGSHSPRTSFKEKVAFMKQLAKYLGERVERQVKSPE